MLQVGKRLQVFSIKEIREENETKKLWVKAGSAWVNRDGSLNVYLDVLPLDGKLHVREANEHRAQANGSSASHNNNNNNNEMAMGAH